MNVKIKIPTDSMVIWCMHTLTKVTECTQKVHEPHINSRIVYIQSSLIVYPEN